MNHFATIALFLSFATTASAGDRDHKRGERSGKNTTSESGIWPPESPLPIRGLERNQPGYDTWPIGLVSYDTGPIGQSADALVMDIDYLGQGEGIRGSVEYDFAVDGALYTVEVRDNDFSSRLALHDESGEMVVGYMTSERGAVIFDDEGVVRRGGPGEVDITAIEDYGVPAMLLTNPVFLSSFLAAQGETFEGDGNPPAYWIWPALVVIAKCAEISVSWSEADGWSGSAGWDC